MATGIGTGAGIGTAGTGVGGGITGIDIGITATGADNAARRYRTAIVFA